MDWWVADSYARANHNPVAALAGDQSKAVAHLTVKPGQTVSLDAPETYDPDGDDISYRCFVYLEAGTYHRDAGIQRYATPRAHLVAPPVDAPCSLHVILEVKDNGRPAPYS